MAGFRGIMEACGIWLAPGPRAAVPTPTPTTATIRLEAFTGALAIGATTRVPRLGVCSSPIRIDVNTGGAS